MVHHFFFPAITKDQKTHSTFSGMIFSFFLMTPFIKRPKSPTPPGEDLKELKYDEYLFTEIPFAKSTSVIESDPKSNRKL